MTPDEVPADLVEILARRRYEASRLTDKYPQNWPAWEDLHGAPMIDAFRAACTNGARSDLAAVLPLYRASVLEETARSVADDLAGRDVHTLMTRRPGESRRDQAERIAAAILGDDRGEADPGLALILLGAVLAVLGGAAAFAIVAGLLG